MTLLIDYVSSSQVDSPETLARYIQQNTGTPWPTLKDMIILKKKIKEFFTHYPNLGYSTLCRVSDWSCTRRKRYAHVWQILDLFRYAYQAGALPEIDGGSSDGVLDSEVKVALAVETDEIWRSRLIRTDNRKVRREVLDRWEEVRRPVLV